MGDLQVGETFKHRCFIIVTATGAAATLLADVTCTIYDEGGVHNAGTVAELSHGWYEVTDFTPDAAGAWTLQWSKTADPTDYTFSPRESIFKVGGGEVTDIKADTAAIIALDAVPAKDAVTNANMRDVIGQKTDSAGWLLSDTRSLMGYAKAAAIRGAGTSYVGVCDAGMAPSTTTIVCAELAGFDDDHFNTEYVMTVVHNANSHGAAPETNTPKDITDYTGLTGTFVCNAFTANVEAGDEVMVTRRVLHVVDSTPLIASPTVNSLAYRLSQFVADGDGDFATGTALPSNKSLYDVTKYIADVALPAAPVANSLASRLRSVSLLETTIGPNNRSTTSCELVAGDTHNSAYVGMMVVLDNSEGAPYYVSRTITAYTGASKTVTWTPALTHDAVDAGRIWIVANDTKLNVTVDAIKTRTDNRTQTHTFFSPPVASVTLDTSHTDAALPTVTIPNWTGTVVHVYAGIVFQWMENTNAAANKLSGAQEIQINKAGGGWTDAINFVDDMFPLPLTSGLVSGTLMAGIIDLVGTIDVFNTTAQFQWDEPLTDQDSIKLYGVQTFVTISYY